MLRMLCPHNGWGFSTLGYDGSAILTVVGLVHGEELLVGEDHHCALTLLFELAYESLSLNDTVILDGSGQKLTMWAYP